MIDVNISHFKRIRSFFSPKMILLILFEEKESAYSQHCLKGNTVTPCYTEPANNVIMNKPFFTSYMDSG